ncbi:FadR/GntR family transcriptional regulator [Mycobacterium sp.]|uniref:FadR/GntR family transcriptional regulator n=1 Tax=Mycobacterium sp. TaxID=1785 RepID=UPI003BB07A31
MANVVRAVQLPKMANIVAADLREQIIEGVLNEGDPLPPEDQLMEHARVARTTVREALRILESEGLLVVRRGARGGARIRTPSVSNVARYIGLVLQCEGATLRDVYDARLMLEAPAAGLLARADDRGDIVAALREALANEEEVLDNPVELSRAYGRFHQLLVQLSGSQTFEVLTAVSNRIIQAQADRYMSSRGSQPERRRATDAAHRAHERLVNLIAAGATQDAEELWRKHLAAGDVELLADPEVNSVLDLLD